MATKSPRQTNVIVNYDGKNLDKKITAYLESFSFSDVASGESDNIDITVSNRHKKWFGAWIPEKGDTLTAKIQQKYWENLKRKKNTVTTNCGSFMIDNIKFSGRPLRCVMQAVSIPANEPFNSEERTQTWENATIQLIASEIAANAGIELYYSADEINVEAIEQNGQTDCNFLSSLCSDFGLAMKVYNNKICIFDEETYEKKSPVLTIAEKDLISWDYNTTLAGTYTGALFEYTDPTDEAEYSITIGEGARIKNINVTASNLQEAQLKGIAQLNNANKKITTLSVTIPANPVIFASTVVKITGLSNLNGNYYVEKVKHNIGSAYTMSLSLRYIYDRIKTVVVNAVKEAEEKAAGEGTQYTIKSGDTLWALAMQYYGSGPQYVKIYNANVDIIESTAKERGKANSDNGHWIFPGTVITIPPKE